MTGKQIIKQIANHKSTPRIGFSFKAPYPNDIKHISGGRLTSHAMLKPVGWGKHKDILQYVPDFNGEVSTDVFGNIFGRLGGKTKGECIKGCLLDGWSNFDDSTFPTLDYSYYDTLDPDSLKQDDKYILASLPVCVFSNMRDCRLMENALMDVLLERENVERFLGKIVDIAYKTIESLADKGVDGIFLLDDWGTQDRTFISPQSFRDVFYPAYKKICDTAHQYGMNTFMHSCGNIYGIIDHLISAGIDVFQFDQPELAGSVRLAREFGDRAAFWCPVDIQKVMPTGNKEFIQTTARNMLNACKEAGGCLIAKDYNWPDINVEDEWADWARSIFMENAYL
jgi:uroporphyrinogen decarboxylase